MFTQQAIIGLMAMVPFATALPQATPAGSAAVGPYSDSVLYTWASTDPQCTHTTSKTDCIAAIGKICSSANFTTDYNSTVGDCTAIYMFDQGNSIPTSNTCTAAYNQILQAGIGGALGYNITGGRTADPLYVAYPKSKGTGNCFKKTGDISPVIAADVLPNGNVMGQCTATSKSKRALAMLGSQHEARSAEDPQEGVEECIVEDLVWGGVCSAACLAQVAVTSWLGPFAVVAGLACFGGCEATGYKLYRNCMTNKGSDPNIFDKRNGAQSGGSQDDGVQPNGAPNPHFSEGGASPNTCINIEDQLSFPCQAMQTSLLSYHGCAGAATGIQGSIHFGR